MPALSGSTIKAFALLPPTVSGSHLHEEWGKAGAAEHCHSSLKVPCLCWPLQGPGLDTHGLWWLPPCRAEGAENKPSKTDEESAAGLAPCTAVSGVAHSGMNARLGQAQRGCTVLESHTSHLPHHITAPRKPVTNTRVHTPPNASSAKSQRDKSHEWCHLWGREDALKQKPHQEKGAAEQPQPPAVSWVTESNGQETEKPPVGWQGKSSPAHLVMGSSQQRGR